jgi:hypothetical protein
MDPATPQPATPQPSSGARPTFAGGIALIVVGAITFLLFLLVASAGDLWNPIGFGVIVIAVALFGAAEVWAGILAIKGRPGSRTAGIAVSVVGIVLAIAGLIVAHESYIASFVSGLIMVSSILVIVLLVHARPSA